MACTVYDFQHFDEGANISLHENQRLLKDFISLSLHFDPMSASVEVAKFLPLLFVYEFALLDAGSSLINHMIIMTDIEGVF